MTLPMQEYEVIQTILYCEAKRGSLDISDGNDRAMYIAKCSSFDELKILLVIFETADNGIVNEYTLSMAACHLDITFPLLDRLLRWPWDEGYESR